MATQYPPTFAHERDRYNGPQNGDAESTIGLIRQLTGELATLFRQEFALAKTEVSRSLPALLGGIASVAVSGAILFGGFLVLLAAAVLGLSNAMSPWLAALLVAVAAGLVGYLMLHAGLKKLKSTSLKPQRSAASLRQDKDTLMRKS